MITFPRMLAFIRKEFRQMLRDRSSLTLGLILPMTLLLIFGFGLSLDVQDVPVDVVLEQNSPLTRDLFTKLALSPYLSPNLTSSWHKAENDLRQGKCQAIVRRSLKEHADGREHVQIIVNGRDSNTARIMSSYLESAISSWAEQRATTFSFQSSPPKPRLGKAEAETRIWYNAAMESRYFLVPGVVVLIMTLIGSLLTALIVAREWERGTWEALTATPIAKHEILAGKIVPYFCLGMVGLFLCLAAASFVFDVPRRGSLILIILDSAIYLLGCLGLGLYISAATKSQFLASQIVLVVSFMPTVMLSGFIFDLKSAPLIAQYLACLFPATWYVELLQSLFLAGNVAGLVLRDTAMLGLFAFLLLFAACAKMQKSLE
ncbi:MAG: ABC transporter permease [Desulfovibrio sp.]|nr:ABC transporter permease [Desulfovibrio sp.]